MWANGWERLNVRGLVSMNNDAATRVKNRMTNHRLCTANIEFRPRCLVYQLYIATFWCCFLTVSAQSIYIDAVGGSDSNAGTDPSSPVASVPYAFSLCVQPSCFLLFMNDYTVDSAPLYLNLTSGSSVTVEPWTTGSTVTVSCNFTQSGPLFAISNSSSMTIHHMSFASCFMIASVSSNSSLTLIESKIRYSKDVAFVATDHASMSVFNCTFSDADVSVLVRTFGAGLFSDATSVLNVTDTDFLRNSGMADLAIRIEGEAHIHSVRCVANQAISQAPCIRIAVSDRPIITVDDFWCEGNLGRGSCIFVTDNTFPRLTVSNAVVVNNFGYTSGGFMLTNNGDLVLRNITFDSNSSPSSVCALSFSTITDMDPAFRGSATMENVVIRNHCTCAYAAQLVSPFTVRGLRVFNNGCGNTSNSLLTSAVQVLTTFPGASGLVAISNSRFENNTVNGHGALYYNVAPAVQVTVSDTVFFNNRAGTKGAGLTFEGQFGQGCGAFLLNNSIFDSNLCLGISALCSGGALWFERETCSKAAVRNCRFTNNTANQGGAMFWRAGILEISDSLFTGNTALLGSGGAIALPDAEAQFVCSETNFLDNKAHLFGGGVWATMLSGSVSHCGFSGNSAGSDGGGIYLSDSSRLQSSPISWKDAFFFNNSGGDRGSGGAMFVGENYNIDLVNGHFEANVASRTPALGLGGCVYVSDARAAFTNVTFVNNYATRSLDPNNSGWGRGGCILVDVHASVVTKNCTFDRNAAVASTSGQAQGLGANFFVSGSLYLFNTTVSNSFAWAGAGVYVDSGMEAVLISDSRFVNMTAIIDGAVIHNQADVGLFNVTDSIFEGFFGAGENTLGGVLFSFTGSTYFKRCRFRHGRNLAQGGAFYVYHFVSVEDSYFEDIEVLNGGAVLAYDAAFDKTAMQMPVLPTEARYYHSNAVINCGGCVFYFPRTQFANIGWLNPFGSRLKAINDQLLYNGNRCAGPAATSSPPVAMALFLPDTTLQLPLSRTRNVPLADTNDPPVTNLPIINTFPGQVIELQVYLYDAFRQVLFERNGSATFLYCTRRPFFTVTSAPLEGDKECILTGGNDAVSVSGVSTFRFSVSFTYGTSFFIYASSSASSPSTENPYTEGTVQWSTPFQVILVPCPPGTRVSSMYCVPCGEGEYSLSQNSAACHSCNELASNDGRTSCSLNSDAVFSRQGYFVVRAPNDRSRAESYQCLADSCTGSRITDFPSIVAPNGGVTYEGLPPGSTINSCREGQTGFLCEQCREDWAKWGSKCVDCRTQSGGVVFAYVLLGFCLVAFQHIVAQTSGSRFKIVTSFIQLVIALRQDSAIALFNMRLQTGNSCPFFRTELQIFWVDLIIPLCLFVIQFTYFLAATVIRAVGLTHRIRNSRIQLLFRGRAFLRSTLLLGLVSYSSITSLAIAFLDCVSYPTGENVLWMERGVSCEDPQYRSVIRPVALILLIIGIIVPFAFAGVLFFLRKRNRLHLPTIEPDSMSGDVHVNSEQTSMPEYAVTNSLVEYALGPLFESYRPRFFFYESTLLFRRILFYAVPVVFWIEVEPLAANITPLVQSILVLTYLAVHLKTTPFLRPSDNHLETVALFTLLFLTTVSGLTWSSSHGTDNAMSLPMRIAFWSVLLIAVAGMSSYILLGICEQWRRRIRKRRGVSADSTDALASPLLSAETEDLMVELVEREGPPTKDGSKKGEYSTSLPTAHGSNLRETTQRSYSQFSASQREMEAPLIEPPAARF